MSLILSKEAPDEDSDQHDNDSINIDDFIPEWVFLQTGVSFFYSLLFFF